MNNDLDDFETFMQQRQSAANAYVNGDATPLQHLLTQENPATFFAPFGGYVQGADAVATRYTDDADAFTTGSESHFERLHIGASDGIGYWVGIQHALAYMQGNPDPVPMKLRITELFRREGNHWKLIHRHADTLVSVPAKDDN